jgi:hypothetical protein
LLKDIPLDEKLSLCKGKNAFGNTSLHIAVFHNNMDIINELIKGFTPQDKIMLLKQQNNMGNTPLHIAGYNGHEHIITELLRDIPQKNKNTLVNIANTTGHTVKNISIALETPPEKATLVKDTPIYPELIFNDGTKADTLSFDDKNAYFCILEPAYCDLNHNKQPTLGQGVFDYIKKRPDSIHITQFIFIPSRENAKVKIKLEKTYTETIDKTTDAEYFEIYTKNFDNERICNNQDFLDNIQESLKDFEETNKEFLKNKFQALKQQKKHK